MVMWMGIDNNNKFSFE